jgi:hypothetical protein
MKKFGNWVELGEWILSSGNFFYGNNMEYRPLDHKYKTTFKSKRNWDKLMDGWDVKIEEKKLRGSIL